jgi:hypothetical protein
MAEAVTVVAMAVEMEEVVMVAGWVGEVCIHRWAREGEAAAAAAETDAEAEAEAEAGGGG